MAMNELHFDLFFPYSRFIMKCLVLLAISLGISLAWPAGKQEFDALEDPSWKVWKSFHNKEYENVDEERIRNFIWQDNLKRIVSHNQAHKYKLAMNHLGDLVSLTLELPEVINMKLPPITSIHYSANR